MALRVDFSSRLPSFKTTVKTEGLEVVEVKAPGDRISEPFRKLMPLD